jgi:segregation and condensation protein B
LNCMWRPRTLPMPTRASRSHPNRCFIGISSDFRPSGFLIQRSWLRNSVLLDESVPRNIDLSSTDETANSFDGSDQVSSPATPRQRVETILLLSREPISPRKLVQLADLADATQARTLARQLNEVYDAGGHAFRIEEVAGGFLMLTRPQFASWLRKLERVKPEEHHSQSAIETLAIVAYKQPVLRADIEAIRGVGCDDVLKQLMQRDLIRICGRSEELGRPYLYGTTKSFLQLFGLRSLDRLPRSDWVRKAEVQFDKPLTDNTQPSDSFS